MTIQRRHRSQARQFASINTIKFDNLLQIERENYFDIEKKLLLLIKCITKYLYTDTKVLNIIIELNESVT